MVFIHIYTDVFIWINELSVGLDTTNDVQGVRLSHYHKAIFGGSHPKCFVTIELMIKYVIQDCINIMISDEKKY